MEHLYNNVILKIYQVHKIQTNKYIFIKIYTYTHIYLHTRTYPICKQNIKNTIKN